MELIEGRINEMPPLKQPLVVTLGNFDGVHQGHQALLQKLKSMAQARGLQTALLTFDPHPSHFFSPEGFSYLQTKKDKIEKIRRQGIDFLVIQEFDSQFSELSPSEFLADYFLAYFSPRLIVFGYDFTFGKDGKGDFNFLCQYVDNKKIETYQDQVFKVDGSKVSSSQIREKLRIGDVAQANHWLSYPYRISGEVVFGDGIGKKLGFPTANISNVETLVPGRGVYWGWVYLNHKKYPSVLNIGIRPTVSGLKKRQVEAHILDFSENIYGEMIEFEFLGRLREEKEFTEVATLIHQIKIDITKARMFFQDCKQ